MRLTTMAVATGLLATIGIVAPMNANAATVDLDGRVAFTGAATAPARGDYTARVQGTVTIPSDVVNEIFWDEDTSVRVGLVWQTTDGRTIFQSPRECRIPELRADAAGNPPPIDPTRTQYPIDCTVQVNDTEIYSPRGSGYQWVLAIPLDYINGQYNDPVTGVASLGAPFTVYWPDSERYYTKASKTSVKVREPLKLQLMKTTVWNDGVTTDQQAACPYENGSRCMVQARWIGTQRWDNAAKLPLTGAVTFRPNGSVQLRIVRYDTPLNIVTIRTRK